MLMKKYYGFGLKEELPYIYNKEISVTVLEFKLTLLAISDILSMFLNTSFMRIELISRDEHNFTNISFKVSGNNKSLLLKIAGDIVVVQFDNKEYVYQISLDRDKAYIILLSCTTTFKHKKVTQKIKDRMFLVEVMINDKIYSIYISLNIDYYYDNSFFTKIGEKTSIIDLKRFYMNSFFPKQTDFEKKCDSYMQIFRLIDGKMELFEQLIVVDGFVKEYLLSEITGNLIGSIKGRSDGENTIQIKNYNASSSIDDKMFRRLYLRSRRVNLEEN